MNKGRTGFYFLRTPCAQDSKPQPLLCVQMGQLQIRVLSLYISDAAVLADKTADIQAAWKKLWADWQKKPTRSAQAGAVKMAFVERAKSSTTCTTTYKGTFPFSSANMDAFWDTASLKTSLKRVIAQFAEDVLLKTIEAKTGKCNL